MYIVEKPTSPIWYKRLKVSKLIIRLDYKFLMSFREILEERIIVNIVHGMSER